MSRSLKTSETERDKRRLPINNIHTLALLLLLMSVSDLVYFSWPLHLITSDEGYIYSSHLPCMSWQILHYCHHPQRLLY